MWSHTKRARLRPTKVKKHPTLPAHPVLPDLGVVISARTTAIQISRSMIEDEQSVRRVGWCFFWGTMISSILLLGGVFQRIAEWLT